MKCKNCDSANLETNNYCGNCGIPLRGSASLSELVAAGFLRPGALITCKVKGEEAAATVLEDGRIRYGDKTFDTPFVAIEGIRGYRCDSWSCWKTKDADGKDKPLHNLRVAMLKAKR